jgi:hypothetical protein
VFYTLRIFHRFMSRRNSTMSHFAQLRAGCAAFALLACLATPAFAQAVNLKADLKGSNEVPPNDASATGSMTGSYSPADKKLTWTINYSGMSAPPTAGHFHGPADPDKNAGVVLPFKELVSPIKGEATLTDAQANDLLAGRWYINIHTAKHPGGEIRGQVMK